MSRLLCIWNSNNVPSEDTCRCVPNVKANSALSLLQPTAANSTRCALKSGATVSNAVSGEICGVYRFLLECTSCSVELSPCKKRLRGTPSGGKQSNLVLHAQHRSVMLLPMSLPLSMAQKRFACLYDLCMESRR